MSIAEGLQVVLLTADRRLASAPGAGPGPNIEVLSPIHRTGAGVYSPHLTGAKAPRVPFRVNPRSDGAEAGFPWPTRGPLGAPTGPWRTLEIGGVPGQPVIFSVSGGRSQAFKGCKSPLGHRYLPLLVVLKSVRKYITGASLSFACDPRIYLSPK